MNQKWRIKRYMFNCGVMVEVMCGLWWYAGSFQRRVEESKNVFSNQLELGVIGGKPKFSRLSFPKNSVFGKLTANSNAV